MKLKTYTFRGFFKAVFFVVGIILIIGMVLYIQKIIYDLRNDNRRVQELYANVLSQLPEAGLDEFNFIYNEFIQKSYFPVVETDLEGNPSSWRGIDVESRDFSPEAIKKVRSIVKILDRESDPMPLKFAGDTLSYLHFGDPQSIRALQILPYIQIVFIGLFMLLGFIGYNIIRRGEQRFIWVGMAKETAHQLGTPISSLMGWVDLLSPKVADQPELKSAFKEINNDIYRLNKIAQRFSQIGSSTELIPEDLSKIIHGVVMYFRRRLPQMKRGVAIIEQFGEAGPVHVNRELFEWVLENIIKNSLDSITTTKGKVEIALHSNLHDKTVFIDIVDNGKGISKKNWNMIFRPGFSTKKRGWGLGLSLAKRIIEDYHKGKLYIEESRPGEGTTMRIKLKL